MSKVPDIEKQIDHEITIMSKMISIYCKGNHLTEDGLKRKMGNLCSDCQELLDYALLRIDNCPVRQEKEYCSNCAIHCYKPEMRERIRVVMRYSGPRMLLHNPILAIQHLSSVRKTRAKQASVDQSRQNQSPSNTPFDTEPSPDQLSVRQSSLENSSQSESTPNQPPS